MILSKSKYVASCSWVSCLEPSSEVFATEQFLSSIATITIQSSRPGDHLNSDLSGSSTCKAPLLRFPPPLFDPLERESLRLQRAIPSPCGSAYPVYQNSVGRETRSYGQRRHLQREPVKSAARRSTDAIQKRGLLQPHSFCQSSPSGEFRLVDSV
jgi:hypothetical protein